MVRLRVAAGLTVAGFYLLLAAPLAGLGRYWRLRSAAYASVWLHRLLCATLGVKVRAFGARGSGGRLLIANHVSWLDILVLGAVEPVEFVAKKEVGAARCTRWLVDLQGAVYVDRVRRRGIPAVNDEIAGRLIGGASIVLFAEGTTSDGLRLLPLRSSHFEAARQAGADVQPVLLDYCVISGMRATRRNLSKIAWYGDMPFLPSLWRVMACDGVSCDVCYGDIITYRDAHNRKSLARRTEVALRSLKARRRQTNNRQQAK